MAKTLHGNDPILGDLQGELPLFNLGDKQGASPLVRHTLVAGESTFILVPALPA
jgi:hypothetical protein